MSTMQKKIKKQAPTATFVIGEAPVIVTIGKKKYKAVAKGADLSKRRYSKKMVLNEK